MSALAKLNNKKKLQSIYTFETSSYAQGQRNEEVNYAIVLPCVRLIHNPRRVLRESHTNDGKMICDDDDMLINMSNRHWYVLFGHFRVQ